MAELPERTRNEIVKAISKSWGIEAAELQDADLTQLLGTCDLLSQLFGGPHTKNKTGLGKADAVTRQWLREPRERLGGRKPIDLIQAGEMPVLAAYVEEISGLM